MQCRLAVFCSLACLLATPAAWSSPPEDPASDPRAGEVAQDAHRLPECTAFMTDRPVPNVTAAKDDEKRRADLIRAAHDDYKKAHACARNLERHLQKIFGGWDKMSTPAPEIGGADLSTDARRRRYLIRLHSIYRQVKQRVQHFTEAKQSDKAKALGLVDRLDEAEALALVDRLDVKVHDLMGEVGMRERVAAAFDGGVSFAEAGNDSVRSGRDTTLETKGRGLIRWETEHGLAERRGRFDYSVAGTFGFVPVLTLVSVDTGTGIIMKEGSQTLPQPFATYFSGLTWDVAPRANIHSSERAEFSFLYRFGQTWLTTDIETFQRRAGERTTQVVLSRLRNGTGRVARFQEIGLEFRLHGAENRDRLEHEQSYLNPAASFALGLRGDTRFSAGEELIGTNGGRFFLRTALSLNRVLHAPADSRISSVQVGVEFEGSLSHEVPSSIRLFIGPDINVVKLLRADTP